jgi:membrane protein required for colicin V production
MNLGVLDWIFIVVLVLSTLLGAWRGLVAEVLSVVGWIAAFIVAQLFATTIGQLLPTQGFSDSLRYAAGFACAFIGTAFAAGLVTWMVKKMIESVGLRPVDRTLGAAFGLVRGTVLLLAAATVVSMTPMKDAQWWRQSQGANVLSAVLRNLKPVLPAELGKFINVALTLPERDINAAAQVPQQKGFLCVES